MADTFDPYRMWLGIPPGEQPPNYYRLLGVPPFEEEPEAIEHAADQRMAHLRTLQSGKHAHLTQKLLNEVAAARVCLLNPEKKAGYDRQLRQQLQAASATAQGQRQHPQPPPPPITAPGSALPGGQPVEQATAEWTGLGQLGVYQLVEKLGEGGMGVVYKAMHTKLGRVVALKVLPKDRLWDDRAVARFDREMKAAGAVDHPNIVRATDAREVEGTRLLVMEYVDGVDLSELIRRRHPLSVADACELTRQAALGLQCIHEHGLIHRDVKPSNLMLNRQGQVKLLDLGLARLEFQRAGEEVTGTGQAVGTVEYMAPEQFSESRTVDIRSDIYSLGCTFYKLLTGHAPFSGEEYQGTVEQLMAHAKKPVPRINKLRGDVPPEVARVVHRMLAKDPAKRFSTPGEVADALGLLCFGSGLSALLARAEGKVAPPPAPGQALTTTREVSSSSALTQFFQRLKTDGRKLTAGKKSPQQLAVYAGAAAVGILLMLIVIAWGLRSAPAPAGDGVLVFDWPPEQRRGLRLEVDGKRAEFPPGEGPVQYRCTPGDHRIVATRPGFKPYRETITLEPGRRMEIEPAWLPLTHLVLQWPVEDRRHARLEIDGQVPDVSLMVSRAEPDVIRVPLEAGAHKVRIEREGFEAFEQRFRIVEGEDLELKPAWLKRIAEAEPQQPEAVAKLPEREPPPAPEPEEPPPKPAEEKEPSAPAEVPKPEVPQTDPAEARYAEALGPAEALVAAWDFRGALEALAKLDVPEKDLVARLARRRESNLESCASGSVDLQRALELPGQRPDQSQPQRLRPVKLPVGRQPSAVVVHRQLVPVASRTQHNANLARPPVRKGVL